MKKISLRFRNNSSKLHFCYLQSEDNGKFLLKHRKTGKYLVNKNGAWYLIKNRNKCDRYGVVEYCVTSCEKLPYGFEFVKL